MSKRKSEVISKNIKTSSNQCQPTSKRGKGITLTSVAPISLKNVTKITDLNDDCLEHILKFLEIRDLIKVVDTSKYFHSAVSLAYQSRYGQLRVRLVIYPHRYKWFDFEFRWIIVQNMTACLRFLRCFGHLISYLDIEYDQSSHQNRIEIDKYVNKYCADSLIRLRLYSAPKWTMDSLIKPFKKVKSIKLSWCFLANNLIEFNQWFPNMKQLKISYGNQVIHRNHIEKTFSHLEFLSIEMMKCQKQLFYKENVIETLRLNPQLKMLRMSGDVLDAQFLQKATENLTALECLELIWYKRCFNFNGAIEINSIKKLKIFIWKEENKESILLNGQITKKIQFICNQLEEFEFGVKCELTNNDFIDIADFIEKQPNLKTFTLNSKYEYNQYFENKEIKLIFIKALTKIVNLNLCQFSLTIDDVNDFLRECKSLEKFRFYFNDDGNEINLQHRVNDHWKMHNDFDRCKYSKNCFHKSHHFVLERRKCHASTA